MRSGTPSSKQKDVPFYQALDDPETRAVYIRRTYGLHLQYGLLIRPCRSSNTPVVDGSFRNCHHPVDKENALQYALSSSRNPRFSESK